MLKVLSLKKKGEGRSPEQRAQPRPASRWPDKHPEGDRRVPPSGEEECRKDKGKRKKTGGQTEQNSGPPKIYQQIKPTLCQTVGQNFDQTEIPICINFGVIIMIKMNSALAQTWGQNFARNGIPCPIKLGVSIFIKMMSRFGSNLGSEF